MKTYTTTLFFILINTYCSGQIKINTNKVEINKTKALKNAEEFGYIKGTIGKDSICSSAKDANKWLLGHQELINLNPKEKETRVQTINKTEYLSYYVFNEGEPLTPNPNPSSYFTFGLGLINDNKLSNQIMLKAFSRNNTLSNKSYESCNKTIFENVVLKDNFLKGEIKGMLVESFNENEFISLNIKFKIKLVEYTFKETKPSFIKGTIAKDTISYIRLSNTNKHRLASIKKYGNPNSIYTTNIESTIYLKQYEFSFYNYSIQNHGVRMPVFTILEGDNLLNQIQFKIVEPMTYGPIILYDVCDQTIFENLKFENSTLSGEIKGKLKNKTELVDVNLKFNLKLAEIKLSSNCKDIIQLIKKPIDIYSTTDGLDRFIDKVHNCNELYEFYTSLKKEFEVASDENKIVIQFLNRDIFWNANEKTKEKLATHFLDFYLHMLVNQPENQNLFINDILHVNEKYFSKKIQFELFSFAKNKLNLSGYQLLLGKLNNHKKEAIKILKSNLNTSPELIKLGKQNWESLVALGRLKYKNFDAIAVSKLTNKTDEALIINTVIPNLIYINTKLSYVELYNLYHSEIRISRNKSNAKYSISIKHFIVAALSRKIHDFPIQDFNSITPLTDEEQIATEEWFLTKIK